MTALTVIPIGKFQAPCMKMMRVFMTMLCSLLAVCSVSARISRQEGTDGQAAIYRLPLFERAVLRCTKYFEGWHSEKHHPYVGWGHKILPDEKVFGTNHDEAAGGRASAERLAEVLRDVPAVRRRQSTLLATLSLQCGTIRGFWAARQSPKAP